MENASAPKQMHMVDASSNYAHTEPVHATATAVDSNIAIMTMMAQMNEQASKDRLAAAADREALAADRLAFRREQQQHQQQQQQQHRPVEQPQQQQQQKYQQTYTQQPHSNQQQTRTVITTTVDPPDHCQHFICCIFFCGAWFPIWLLACVIPGFCPNPCCCCAQRKTTHVVTYNQ